MPDLQMDAADAWGFAGDYKCRRASAFSFACRAHRFRSDAIRLMTLRLTQWRRLSGGLTSRLPPYAGADGWRRVGDATLLLHFDNTASF